jgi:RNA polymerase sigma-70 factor (ECF subfamily)
MIATRSISAESFDQTAAGDFFSSLYERFGDDAYGLALRLTGNRALADDAFQEAMLRVWRAAPSYRPGNARAWIFRIVARESLRARRNSCRCKKREIVAHELRRAGADEMPDHSDLLRLALDAAITRMPPSERKLLKLSFFEGKSQRKISAAMAAPQQTISHRLHTAIQNLRRDLNHWQYA